MVVVAESPEGSVAETSAENEPAAVGLVLHGADAAVERVRQRVAVRVGEVERKVDRRFRADRRGHVHGRLRRHRRGVPTAGRIRLGDQHVSNQGTPLPGLRVGAFDLHGNPAAGRKRSRGNRERVCEGGRCRDFVLCRARMLRELGDAVGENQAVRSVVHGDGNAFLSAIVVGIGRRNDGD